MTDQGMNSNPAPAQIAKPDGYANRILSWAKDKVFGALVVASVLSALGLYFSRAADLRYVIGKADSQSTVVTISNGGSLAAEEIDCEIKLQTGEISAVDSEPSILNAVIAIDSDKRRAMIRIPRLNPSEKTTISVKAGEVGKTFSVSVRGKGISATKDDPNALSIWGLLRISFLMLVLFFGLVVLATFSKYLELIRDRKEESVARKIFKFLNGPLTDKYSTGEEANILYRQLGRRSSMTVQGTEYFTLSKSTNKGLVVFSMVCGDSVLPNSECVEFKGAC